MKNWCKIIKTEEHDVLVQLAVGDSEEFNHAIEIAQGDFAKIKGVEEIEEITGWAF